MLVFDRYPLVDGTFFLSPRQHSKCCLEVSRLITDPTELLYLYVNISYPLFYKVSPNTPSWRGA